MRIDQYTVVLDACVPVRMPVADTLLRLAEEPAFYSPRWSPDILDEVQRTLTRKWSFPAEAATRRVRAMSASFPEAMVEGYGDLIGSMKNDPGDRHVLAAAVRCEANGIVSNNKQHFPEEALRPYGIECLTADEFLTQQYHLNPDLFITKLTEQAEDIGHSLHWLISNHVPSLAELITIPAEE